MPQDKPHVPSKYTPVLQAARSFMQNSQLFGGRGGPFGFTGGDNLADTKHKKLWQDFGYPDTIEFYMHWNMWRRNGLARRGTKLPVSICWVTDPWIEENKDDNAEPTEYEELIDEILGRLNAWPTFQDGDLCQRVGRYGALLITIADGKPRQAPVENIRADQIVRIQPLFEGQLEPGTVDRDKNSPRFGLPLAYTLQTNNIGGRNEDATDGGQIHWTRLIMLSEDALGTDIYGIPCNEGGFNALLNWQKIQGSGAEGFWRAAAQRFVVKATGGTEAQQFNPDELKELSEMVAAMFAGFDAIPSLGNYEMDGLDVGSMPDPQHHKNMCLEEYSASVGIPAKMLVGTQTGVKAADEDTSFFMQEMQSRRRGPLSKWVMSFIDWLDEHTDVKKPDSGVKVCWDDLTAPSAEKKLEQAAKMAVTNKTQVDAGQRPVFHGQEIREAAGYETVDALGDWDDDLIEVTPPATDDDVPAE